MISCLQVYLIENENTRGIQKKNFVKNKSMPWYISIMSFEILDSTEKSFKEYVFQLSDALDIPRAQMRLDFYSGVSCPCSTIAVKAWQNGKDYKDAQYTLLRQFLYLDESEGSGSRAQIEKYWYLKGLEGQGQIWSQKKELAEVESAIIMHLNNASKKGFI